MSNEVCPKTGVLYPQYGYTQKELRFIYVDCGARMLYDNEDNPEYIIHDDGPINPLRPDLSGFWLEMVATQ